MDMKEIREADGNGDEILTYIAGLGWYEKESKAKTEVQRALMRGYKKMAVFNGQDSPAFDEVMEVLKRYHDFEYIQMNDDSILSVPGLEIYPGRRKIYRGRKEISLTAKEYELFYLLVVNRGQVFTYGRTQRPPRGVVPNRGKYMGTMGTACGSFPLAFPGLLQYCVMYRRLMPGTSGAGQAKQLTAGMLHLHRIKAVGCQ